MKRREESMKLNSCHEIAVFILNDEGQVLLQKRSSTKKYYPNMWTLCTGHVEKGESASAAAIRELKEELDVTVSLDNLYSFIDGKFDSNTTWFFYIKCNFLAEEFIIQEEELSEVAWFSIDSLIDMIKNQNGTIVYKENKLDLFLALKEFVNRSVL